MTFYSGGLPIVARLAGRHARRFGIPAPGLTILAMAALCALSAPPAVGQSAPDSATACPDGRITSIFIDNHSIFDVDQAGGRNPLRWAYRLANALHVNTRRSFIRRELLFHKGDCFDPLLLAESGRILRSYGFIAHADVFAVDQDGGAKHVVVDTQDEWTTRVDMGVSFDGGLQIEGVRVTEENLLGRGVLASVFLKQRKERQDIGARIGFPRLFGTRMDFSTGAGRTRNGSFADELLSYPFVGEVGRVALRQSYRRRDELFQYSAGLGRDYSHVLLPLVDERFEVSVAGRLGQPGNLTLFGFGVSRERLKFNEFPGSVELVTQGDFGNPTPAPLDIAETLAGQVRATSTTRVNLMLGQRNVRFRRMRGLDALKGDRDVQLGTDFGLTIGKSVDVLTSSTTPSRNDLYTRFRAFAGFDPGSSLILTNLGFDGRRSFSGNGSREGWRDVIGEFDLYTYLRTRALPSHTVFARLSASGGWSMDTPFQLTLGGRDGVRGFLEEAYPGARRVLATVEDRVYLGWPMPDVFDLGLSLFADAGRTWDGGTPFGRSSRWKGTVGFGLRLGFPAGTRGVTRLDLAFPVGGGGSGPIFRVTLFERLGVVFGFSEDQLRRSRRMTIGPDSFVQTGG